jgi:soluble lytic murein transglycosylase-like protein
MKSARLLSVLAVSFAATDSHAFCFAEAANRLQVDANLLMAIAKVESNLSPNAINTNKNGSIDVGLMQINSQHFKSLEKFNITEGALMEPCVNVHVGAWILARTIKEHGATWRAVGAYNAGSRSDREEQRSIYASKVLKALNEKPSKRPTHHQPPTKQEFAMQVVE